MLDAPIVKHGIVARAACIFSRASGLPVCIGQDTCPHKDNCAARSMARMTNNASSTVVDYIKALWPAGVLFVSFATAFAVQSYKITTLTEAVGIMRSGFDSRTEMFHQLRVDLAVNRERLVNMEEALRKMDTTLDEIKGKLKQ